jgi:hypothetical protein
VNPTSPRRRPGTPNKPRWPFDKPATRCAGGRSLPLRPQGIPAAKSGASAVPQRGSPPQRQPHPRHQDLGAKILPDPRPRPARHAVPPTAKFKTPLLALKVPIAPPGANHANRPTSGPPGQPRRSLRRIKARTRRACRAQPARQAIEIRTQFGDPPATSGLTVGPWPASKRPRVAIFLSEVYPLAVPMCGHRGGRNARSQSRFR